MRFYLDEHVQNAVAEGLRSYGVDVITVGEAGRIGEPDEEQLAFATTEGRVMVTFNDGYLVLDARGIPRAGIAFAQVGQRSVGELIESLLLIAGAMEIDEMKDRVEFI